MTTAASTSTTEQLVQELYRLNAIQRHWFRQVGTGLGLGSAGLSVLGALRRLGALRVSDLATEIGVDLSVASRHVTTLQNQGYVGRETDPRDRRAQLVALTDAGHALLVDAHQRLVSAFGEVLADWSEDEAARMAADLERLRRDFEGGCR